MTRVHHQPQGRARPALVVGADRVDVARTQRHRPHDVLVVQDQRAREQVHRVHVGDLVLVDRDPVAQRAAEPVVFRSKFTVSKFPIGRCRTQVAGDVAHHRAAAEHVQRVRPRRQAHVALQQAARQVVDVRAGHGAALLVEVDRGEAALDRAAVVDPLRDRRRQSP